MRLRGDKPVEPSDSAGFGPATAVSTGPARGLAEAAGYGKSGRGDRAEAPGSPADADIGADQRAETRRLDVAAMRRLAEGDASAFNEVYARHRIEVFGFLCRLCRSSDLADDLLQTTFLRVLQSPGRYDERWPLRTWLLGIARNAFIDWTRKTRREVDPASLMGDPWTGEGAAELWNPPDPRRGDEGYERLVAEEERTQLERALERVAWPQREAILLVKVAGLSIRDAAAVIGGTEGMVKMRLRRGLLRLMEILGVDTVDTPMADELGTED